MTTLIINKRKKASSHFKSPIVAFKTLIFVVRAFECCWLHQLNFLIFASAQTCWISSNFSFIGENLYLNHSSWPKPWNSSLKSWVLDIRFCSINRLYFIILGITSHGGLGFRLFADFNSALLAKLGWKILSNESTL